MIALENMTTEDIKNTIKEEKLLIFTVGSLEQHGPHLPLATDSIIPYEISKKVAKEVNAVVAPPTTYGYKSKPRSGGGENFSGTISMQGKTLICLVKDLINSFLKDGFKKILVLNWHLENVDFVYEGVDLALADGQEGKVVIIDNPNSLVEDKVLDEVFDGNFPGWAREHAAIFETSLMMALKPDLVKNEKVIDDESENYLPYDVLPVPDDAVPASGVFWHATQASPEKGNAITESLVKALINLIEKEF